MKVFPIFATGINDTSSTCGKFAAGVDDTSDFMKKIEMILMILLLAWGKMIHKKTRRKKSRDTVPLGAGHVTKYASQLLVRCTRRTSQT